LRVCHIFPTVLLHDGPTNVLLALLKQLDANGIENTVVSMREPPEGRSAEQIIRSLRANYIELGMKKGLLDIETVPSLARLIRRDKFQIVQCNLFRANIYGALATRLAGSARSICVAHNVERYMTDSDVVSRAARTVERQCVRFASAYVGVSQAVGSAIRDLLALESDKIAIIQNGLDDSPLIASRGEARERLGVDSTAVLIGSVGRLHPQKSYADLLTAIAGLTPPIPQLKVVVVGDGPERQALNKYRDKLGLEGVVSFVGARSDVIDILPAFDTFVMTSTYEGLPVALIEAMRSGIPAVVTDAGGMPEAVVHGLNGFVAERGDVKAVGDYISRLARDPRLRQEMSLAARQRFVCGFSAKTMAQNYLALYESVLRKPRPAVSFGT
jgi:glycosyltransferase involved in cell wall biosynthesis